MSLFARPAVVFAIIFGCFAVLVPRIFLPLFRSKPPHRTDDHFRRPPSSMPRGDYDDTIERIPGSPPRMHDSHINTRVHHPADSSQQQLSTDQISSKPAITFALPMYTVGIGVFFLYTCFKYWTKRDTPETKIKLRYSTDNIQWNAQKKNFKYHINNRHNEDDGEDEEELYNGLDADYVEYLKLKKQKELEAKQVLTTEQRQMHSTLDEMKHSLSFISSKLGKNKTNNNLTNNEISQLQNRLASTEAQMYKILSALDAASNKMNEITKNTRESLEQPQQAPIDEEEEEHHLSSRSHSEHEGSENDEENSNSDDNSSHEEEQVLSNKQEEEEEGESSSSYEEEEVPHEIEDDDEESESSSERYGIMTTNYECDPEKVDDYELGTNQIPDQTSDSRTKVQQWHQRNHSQSLGSSNSSINQDQSIPTEEQNRLTRRKRQD